MPRRGYRKGISDTKTARPHLLRCRVSTCTLERLDEEASGRSVTRSSLMSAILDAFADGQRLELPHNRMANGAALRELARIGSNLNQLAHHANLMHLHLLQEQVHQALEAFRAAAARL